MGGANVWGVLELYFELRESYPIPSILHTGGTGHSDSTSPGLPRNVAFLADIGSCLAALTKQEQAAVEAAFILRCLWTRADIMRREASLDIFKAIKGHQRTKARKARRQWTKKADEYQEKLHNIRVNPHYRSAMNRLEISIPLTRVLGGYISKEESLERAS